MAKHSPEEGKTSGSVYNCDKQLNQVILNSMAKYAWANPLHPQTFPGVRKMEAEIVVMVVDMFHGTEIGACGTMTSGGTESILMAIRAHREWAKDQKGITSPHMILPVTAHPAFDKAADYFGIRVTHIAYDPVTYQVDIRKLKQAICRNTILIVGSCPSFPHGCQDDILTLSGIAIKNNIGLHVDCCLGGFIAPFMEAAGYPIPPFDFRVPGVTSISADPHKYGYSPKGSSVVLYRTPELRQYQYFCCTDWPGGVYASPSIAGSRPGNIIVGCWAAMVYI
jgi:sphinganine-1-phosphate aldolase